MTGVIAIIGGGPAGAAAAIAFARAGRSVRLLERQRETGDAICGGFLSWRTLAQLRRLGIGADDLGGQRITHLRLFAGENVAESSLPQGAMGVSRHRLDTLLLETAATAGATIERGVRVRALGPNSSIDCGAAGELGANHVLVATGKYDLPGEKRTMSRRLASDPVLGLRVRIGASDALARLVGDAIELHVFRGGYAGLVRHENGSGNLCMAVRKSRLSEAGGAPAALLARLGAQSPHLGARIALIADSPRIDAIAAIPYGYIAPATRPGQFRIGDQAAVIPSLAGEGIGIALASANAAVEAVLNGATASAFQADFARRAALPMRFADAAWRAAEHETLGRIGVGIARLWPSAPGLIARTTRIG